MLLNWEAQKSVETLAGERLVSGASEILMALFSGRIKEEEAEAKVDKP